MVINLNDIEVKLQEAGQFVLKISGFEHTGYVAEGEKFKMTLRDSIGRVHYETFTTAPNMLWKIENLRAALEAPKMFDPELTVGYYVTVTMVVGEYNGKPKYEVASWGTAQQNDKLPKIPEAKSEEADIAAEAEELF